MKKHIILFFIGCMFFSLISFGQEDFRGKAPEAGPAPKIELGKAEQFTLDNGLKAIVVENHKLPRVSFSIFVDVPPFLEKETTGAANIAGQLLRTGTSTRSKGEIDLAVDFIGASLNTSFTGVSGSSLVKHKDALLEVMQDVLMNPTFSEEEFDKIKNQTLSALAQQKEDPNAIASNVAQVLRYGKDHPYGEIETESTIQNLTVDNCKEYYSTYFKPNISYLTIVGDITASEAKALAEKYFGGWEKGSVLGAEFDLPSKPDGAVANFVNKTGAVQSVINITYPVNLKPGEPDVIKSSVMNTMLGGYFSSRLNSNLREDKGYTYGAGSNLRNDKVVGSFTASASVRNEVTDSSLVEFLSEMKRIVAEATTDKELTLVKNVMTGSFARSLENPQTIARFARNIARYNLPEDYYASYLEKLNAVTKEDILEMAQKYISPENCHILVVGNKDEVSEKLAAFATDGKINFFDANGEPITDDGTEIPDGVTAETIIADYIAALGGEEKLKSVNTMATTMEASTPMGAIQMIYNQKSPNLMKMEVAMNGNVMQTMTFDGTQGKMSAMGQSQDLPQDMIEELQAAGQIFPELHYEKNGVKATLTGIEKIGEENAYIVSIELPSGAKRTHYFDMKSSLKVRQVKTQEGATEITDLLDYTEVEGVKIPHTTKISGAMPMTLEMKIKSVELNGEIADDKFQIN